MRSTRKTFLAATASAGAAMLVTGEPAATTAAATPSPTPAASPSPAATPTPAPSPAARALAEKMRAFDATLSDKQIHEIAGGIQEEWAIGTGLRSKAHPLANGDPPDPQFEVEK